MRRVPSLGWSVVTLVVGFSLACAGGDGPAAPTAAPAPSATPTTAPATPTTAPTATAPTAAARPLYYDRDLAPADLDGRTLRELSLMRNTIFARAGNPFVKPWLNEHFRAQPWYSPQQTVDLAKLTDYDRRNVDLITAREAGFTRAQLLVMRDLVNARGASTPEDRIELSLISAALGEWQGSADVPAAQRNPLEDPNVLSQQLTLAQVEVLSRRDLRLLRNTIYARHGRPFKSEILQVYFADKAWYHERADYSDAMLTDVDKRNIQLVQSMEDRLGGPMREWEHQKEEGWFQGA